MIRYKCCVALTDSLNRRTGKGIHFHKPLQGNFRLDDCVTALACADVVAHRFNFKKIPQFSEIVHNSLTRFEGGQSGVGATLICHMSIIGQDINYRQVMTQSDFVIVRIVRRRNFYVSGPEFRIDVRIGNNRYIAIGKRKMHHATDVMSSLFIVGVHRDGRVSKHCLGACSRDGDRPFSIGEGVTNRIEKSVLFLMFHFNVGDRSQTGWTPVDHTLAAIDQPFLV